VILPALTSPHDLAALQHFIALRRFDVAFQFAATRLARTHAATWTLAPTLDGQSPSDVHVTLETATAMRTWPELDTCLRNRQVTGTAMMRAPSLRVRHRAAPKKERKPAWAPVPESASTSSRRKSRWDRSRLSCATALSGADAASCRAARVERPLALINLAMVQYPPFYSVGGTAGMRNLLRLRRPARHNRWDTTQHNDARVRTFIWRITCLNYAIVTALREPANVSRGPCIRPVTSGIRR
jgi:hypothetical protein